MNTYVGHEQSINNCILFQYEDLDESRKNVFKSLFAVATDRSDAAALSNFVATVTRFLADEEEVWQ